MWTQILIDSEAEVNLESSGSETYFNHSMLTMLTAGEYQNMFTLLTFAQARPHKLFVAGDPRGHLAPRTWRTSMLCKMPCAGDSQTFCATEVRFKRDSCFLADY